MKGYGVYEYTKQNCSIWKFMESHTYYADAMTGMPVAQSGGGDDLVWLNVSTEAFNADVFYVPNGCDKTMCPSNN